MLALALCVTAAATPVAAQEAAGEHEGAAATGVALRRLGTTARVLMIGAHPDDENTAVLSALALGAGANVAYLSLTRGEGGQNLIGPELQEGLGIIRTGELLAARRLDGAHQFFTRAYDFGYSRSAEEAFEHWPRDSLLADVVATVRRFRPDVLISVFSGTPADGHGQHQVAGIMAREAFEAAGDAMRFPGQVEAGLRPHRPAYLFQAAWRPRGGEPIVISSGDYDALLGRSFYQVAMASRSRHRSQDMGRPEPLGPRVEAIRPMAGEYPADGSSLFAGVDTTLTALAAGAPGALEPLLAYERMAAEARARFNPLDTASLVPLLAPGIELLERAAHEAQRGPAGSGATSELLFEIAAERADLEAAIWAASGLVFEATADDARVVPGQLFGISVAVWNGGAAPVVVRSLEPRLPAVWEAVTEDALPGAPLQPGEVLRRDFRVRLPAAARVTEPYYLRELRAGDFYRWPDDASPRGLPFEPSQVRAAAAVVLNGVTIERSGDAMFLDIDKALGERRTPVLVVPAIDVRMAPRFVVMPAAAAAEDGSSAARNGGAAFVREITVELRSESTARIEGAARLVVPAGWRANPAAASVSFERPGELRTVRFTIEPAAAPENGEYTVQAVFETADGGRYGRGYAIIDYPHILPTPLYRDAATQVSVFPVSVAEGLSVGYVEGAGDDGALALRQLGAEVVALDSEALARGDLSGFDAIVLGIRVYETRLDLVAHNDRLLDYARAGGTVIAQYNQYEYADGDFTPYPLSMARPHGRVTDENAPVRLLDPAHPVLSTPNRIDASDFAGWVQERGLYFADEWDDRFTPLLEMADPGQPAQRGSLLAARVGEGWYVYTGLALFRQLPDGVPGAFRLLANLISLGSDAR